MSRKAIWILFLFLALLVAGGLALSSFFASEVRTYLLTMINRRLTVPVAVKDISFSLFGHFPDAALEFKDVLIREKNTETPDTLLFAHKISLRMSLWQLFSKTYSVKRLDIEEALLNPGFNAKGEPTYVIWKTGTEAKGSAGFDLQKVIFSEVRMVFHNDFKKQFFRTHIPSGEFKGAFSQQLFDLEADVSLEQASFRADGVDFLRDRSASLHLVMKTDMDSGLYSIISSELDLEGLPLKTSGTLRSVGGGLETNLLLTSAGSDPKAIVALLPKAIAAKINTYHYSGKVVFEMKVQGLLNEKKSPLVDFRFQASRVNITPREGGEALKQVSFNGFYTNKKKEAKNGSYLAIRQLTARLNGNPLSGDLELSDFKHPYLTFHLNGQLDLKTLARFVPMKQLENPEGMVTANMAFAGKIGELRTYKASGSMQLDEVSFFLRNGQMAARHVEGRFSLHGNDVQLESLSGNIGESDFRIDGTLSNLWSYLLLPGEKFKVDASLASPAINLDTFLGKGKADAGAAGKGTSSWPELSDIRLRIQVDRFRYQQFEAQQLQGVLSYANQELSTGQLAFNSMGGSAILKSSVRTSRSDSLLMSVEARVMGIDINRLFSEMGNFGQEVIRDQNLRGKATADVQFASTWSADMVCNTEKMYARADITIDNGELINFEPTMALTRYLKGVDLRNIRFSTLHDVVEIRNRTIYFSSMEIKSSALDLTASGTHTFDNMVDYKINLLLSHVLGKKVKEQNTEFGTIEDDGLGRTRLFLRMSGPMKNPKFTYDSKSVEEKIEKDIRDEKQNLKNVLNKEFGWFKKDSAAVKKELEPLQQEDIQIDYEEEEK